MTDERMTLIELVEKAADTDLVREMLAFAADRMMDAEVETETCAAKGGAHAPAGEGCCPRLTGHLGGLTGTSELARRAHS